MPARQFVKYTFLKLDPQWGRLDADLRAEHKREFIAACEDFAADQRLIPDPQGQGAQAWTTYWFSPRNKLQFGFRHQKVSHEFIPSGGTLADASVRAEFWPRSSFSLSASVQYEMWNFPVIASTRQTNVTSAVQLSFWPKGFSRKVSDQ